MSTQTEVLVTARAVEVNKALIAIKDSMKDSAVDLAYLLYEANENKYYNILGFSSFGDWIEGSDLDISERLAFYYCTMIKKANILGITSDQLKQAKQSKLREIFVLDPHTQGDEIKALVSSSQEETLAEVKDKIQGLRARDGVEPTSFLNIKLLRSVKDGVVADAFELVRRMYGSTVDEQGSPVDISDGRCLELICEEFLQDPNHYPATSPDSFISVAA